MAAVSESRIRIAATFAAHQIIATLGVMVATPFVLALVSPAFRIFGVSLSVHQAERLLAEMHYFPLQMAFGFLLGWVFGRCLQHRSAQWVWVIPTLLVLSLIITNYHLLDLRPAATMSFPDSPLSHFFDSSCRPEDRCFDQIVVTLPFYSAVAYSIGSLIGRRSQFARQR